MFIMCLRQISMIFYCLNRMRKEAPDFTGWQQLLYSLVRRERGCWKLCMLTCPWPLHLSLCIQNTSTGEETLQTWRPQDVLELCLNSSVSICHWTGWLISYRPRYWKHWTKFAMTQQIIKTLNMILRELENILFNWVLSSPNAYGYSFIDLYWILAPVKSGVEQRRMMSSWGI